MDVDFPTASFESADTSPPHLRPHRFLTDPAPAPDDWSRRLREDAARIVADTLGALDPAGLTAHALADHLDVLGWSAEIARRPSPGRTVLVAVGKAALPMARGALSLLGRAVDDAVILVPHAHLPASRPGWLPDGLRIRGGGHPVPDSSGRRATAEILELVGPLGRGDRLLVLISGGGSALLHDPRPEIDPEDHRAFTRLLLEAGLAIDATNLLRTHLETVKGGGLARAAAPAEILGLVLSDVPGDDPAVVASGPLSEVRSRPRDAEALLRREALWDDTPPSIQRSLTDRRRDEPPGFDVPPPDPAPRVTVIGSGADAVRSAMAAARRIGYTPNVLSESLSGEARRAGRGLARAGLAVRDGVVSLPLPACLIATGETTVTVRGSGRGGRNQEVALGAAQYLRGRDGVLVASVGTDGIDGPTDAAGGWADGRSWSRAADLGRSIDEALERNDAYPLLEALGDLLITGPTGTNVADLMLVLVDRPPE